MRRKEKTRHLVCLSSKSSLKCRHLCFYYIINFYRLVAGVGMDITYRATWVRVPLVIDLRYRSISLYMKETTSTQYKFFPLIFIEI